MMRWFLAHVIGGETGKRESAWFAFVLWIAATVWIGWAEFTSERRLETTTSMWMLVTPLVWAWLGAAHGFDWVSKQTSWGSRPAPASYQPPSPLWSPQQPTHAVYEPPRGPGPDWTQT